jgi:hypothetical protein
VSHFLEVGLRRRQGVIAIATPATLDVFRGRLAAKHLDPESYVRRGQLLIHDADEMLSHIMRRGRPQWEAFQRIVGNALESVQVFGRGRIRAYGEMVNILWRDGRRDAAIELEEFWNALGRLYPFCLFCGYMLDSHDPACYHGPIHEIGRTHSDILATADDERFQTALDAACQEIFGVALSEMVRLASQEDHPGESRLPAGRRTMLWIMRHMPGSSGDVLERVRRHYAQVS